MNQNSEWIKKNEAVEKMLLCGFFFCFFWLPGTFYGAEIKRKEHDVKQSCPPVYFSCAFIFIQATSRLRSIYFDLFMLSEPAEPWPFHVQTQQGTPLTALSFVLRIVRLSCSCFIYFFVNFPSPLLKHTVLHVSSWRCRRWERGSEICLRASYWLILTSATVS